MRLEQWEVDAIRTAVGGFDAGKIRWRLWELIGEQKIDIVIAKDASEPSVRIAMNEGVLL